MASDTPSTPTPDAASATAVKPAETAPSAAVKPLPPPRQPPSPEGLAARLRLLDGLLVAVVLAFAFLSALFPARNSDFFLHAATGRLIAHGQYQIGVDPFAFTTQGVPWINPSWLYDLIVYLVYDGAAFGGTILVVLKALMIAALAEVMLRTAREPGRRLWIPACCVGLAVLALSPRVYLQPACVSLFFLGLTYWLLHLPRQMRDRAAAANAEAPRRPFLAYWLIPPLCLLWANVDGWFFLGPALVALYLAGEMLQGWIGPAYAAPARGERRTLLFVLLASVAACVVNPHHVWIFTAPSQLGLSEAAEALRDDEQYRALFITPLEGLYFHASTGLSVAGLAFFPLILLGVVSFAAAQWMGCWRWGRVIVWTAFLGLAFWRSNNIPFFAVLAGPIASMNFLDFATKRFGAAPWVAGRAGAWALGGRVLTLAAGVALLVAAWPGWLQSMQPPPQEWRRVGWTVDPDPALKALTDRINEWRRDGLIEPDARWFNTAPPVLPYLAWYCPGERAFIDNQRLGLYGQAAADFTAIRKSLGSVNGDANSADPKWRTLLKRNGVHLLIWYEGRPVVPNSPLPLLLSASKEWPLLFHYGPVAVFGWRDPSPGGEKTDPFARLELNADKEAFGPGAAPAPPGPSPEPQPAEWWSALWTPEKPRPPDADEAAVQWMRFKVQQFPYLQRFEQARGERYRSTLGAAGACFGTGGPWQGCLAVLCADGDVETRFALARQKLDFGPPAPLYLGIRAARRALAVKPDDALTYRFLVETYRLLDQQTRAGERESAVAYPRMGDANRPIGDPVPLVLRRAQVATALRRALDLDPDNEEAERLSFELYGEWGFIDLALAHGEQRVRIMNDSTATEKEKTDLNNQLKQLRDLVSRQTDTYLLKTANKSVVEKVDTALEMRLGQKALDELLQVDWGKFDEKAKPHALERELSLFVLIGRAEEVRKALIDEEKTLKDGLGVDPDVGLPAYEWLGLQVAVAEGDYAKADDWLEKIQEKTRRAVPLLPMLTDLGLIPLDGTGVVDPDTRSMTALLAGRLILGEAPRAAGTTWLPVPPFYNTATVLGLSYGAAVEPLSRYADLEAIRGWLALEAGDVAAARTHFEAAQQQAPADQIPYRARGLTELGLEWLDAGK